MSTEYVVAYDDGPTLISHLGGIPWNKAPKPRRWHRHWAQTNVWTDWLTQFQRCPCGARRTNLSDQKWRRP